MSALLEMQLGEETEDLTVCLHTEKYTENMTLSHVFSVFWHYVFA